MSAFAQEVTAPPPWRLDLTAGVGYDDNVRFTPSTASATSGRLRASLTRLVRSPRANLTLGAAGEGRLYRPFDEFNGLNYNGDLSATYLVSPRTTLRIGDSLSKTYTDESRLLLDAGLFLPRTASNSNHATIEATHQISPHWSWNLSAQHQAINFDSNVAIDESSFGGRAALSWTPTREFPIGLSYEFGHARPRGLPTSDRHGATLRGERHFREKLSVRLEIGAQKLVSTRVEVNRVVPTLVAGFVIRSPKQSIDASVVRSVNQAFGLGRLQQTSTALLRVTRAVGSRLAVSLNANLSRSEDPGGRANLAFDTRSLGGDLVFRLAKNIELSATGGYRSLEPPLVGRTQSRFATLALRVGQNW